MFRTAVFAAGALLAGTHLARDAERGGRPFQLFSVTYMGANFAVVPGNDLELVRTVAADVVVNGDLVNNSTGVEVQTSGGQTAQGVTATITGRSHSVSSGCNGDACDHLSVRLTSTGGAALGHYKVLIHYVVEIAGPEKFDIQLFDHGSVSSGAITAPGPLSDGAFRVGDNLTLQIQGSGLSNAALVADSAHGMHVVGTPSVSPSSATYTVRFDSSGAFGLALGRLVCDKNLILSCANVPGALYSGSGQLPLVLRLQPRIASVSPSVAPTNSPISITGTGLKPKGFAPFVDFVPRYKTNSQVVRVGTTVVSGGLQVTAPQTPVLPDGAALRYIAIGGPRDSLTATLFALPSTRVVGFAPNLIKFDSVGAPGARRPALKTGSQVITGMNLIPDQATVTTTTTTKSSGGIGDIGVPSVNTSISLLPTLSFGTMALGVQTIGYSATSTKLPGTTGADTIVVSVPAGSFADTITRSLTINTPAGSQATQNVVFVPPPAVTDVRTFNASGIEVSIPMAGGTLVRGKQYRLRGKGLVVAAGASSSVVELPHATLNGTTLVVTAASPPTVEAVVGIPAAASSGPLVVTAFGGTTTVGSFTVADPPPALTIAGLSLSPTSVTGGQPVTATIAINGTVPTGGSAGNIALTTTVPSDALVLPAGLIPVTANPMVVSLSTKAVGSQQTLTVRASSDPNAAQSSATTAGLVLLPPNPTTVTFPQASVAGGGLATGVVHFNTSASLSAGLKATLVNSDPTSATVPGTATISGDSAVFTMQTAVVPVDRPVTVTATMGGVSKSGTFTVRAPTLSSVSASPSSVVPGSTASTVTARLTGPVPAPVTATVSCDAALNCPATLTFAQSLNVAAFTVSPSLVNAPRAAQITVTLNGNTQQGSINLTPLAMQPITTSPPSVRAGAPSSLTIQLNAPVPSGQSLTVSFTSSNPSVVPAPASVTFTPGQNVKLVNLTTQTPGAQPATVTITATSSQPNGTTPITGSMTATLTVTP